MAKKQDEIQPIPAGFDEVVRCIVPDYQASDEITSDNVDFSGLVSATHKGILPVGRLQLECYVLEDGRRVFHKRGMAKALGLKSEGGNAFMKTLGGRKLGSEVAEELLKKIANPVLFIAVGSDPAHGYEAEILVEVCKAVIRANEGDKLSKAQEPMARQAMAIINALAKVGIASLIDEATGYRTERSSDALRLMVQAYIEQEKREWEKEFPDDFYMTLNRVYGSTHYVTRSGGATAINKPQDFGTLRTSVSTAPLSVAKC